MKKQDLTIPNLLSVLRIAVIPFILINYISGNYVAASIILMISGITDMLDGLIARKFNQISNLGKILDPLADKLTMASVVFVIAIQHYQIKIMLGILVFKELLMLIGAISLLGKGSRPCESKFFGKLSTFVLYTVLFIVIICDIISKITYGKFLMPSSIMWIMSMICCVLMVLALWQYYGIFKAIRSGEYNTDTEKFEGEK